MNLDLQDDYSLVFTLEAGFSPFPVNLTLNVLPAHLLRDVEPSQLRSNAFNFNPVGAGPFIFSDLVALQGGGGGRSRAADRIEKESALVKGYADGGHLSFGRFEPAGRPQQRTLN